MENSKISIVPIESMKKLTVFGIFDFKLMNIDQICLKNRLILI